MFTCEFCNNIFKSETILNTHKITAKYCLNIQGKTAENEHLCNYCCKTFTTKLSVLRHENTCSSKLTLETIHTKKENIKLKEENQRLKEEIIKLTQIIQNQEQNINQIKEQIIEKTNKIEKLENHFIKLAEKPLTINTNTNTTTNN